MDIKEELKELMNDDKSANSLMAEINQEKVKLEKKLHIIQVVSITNRMEKAVEEKFFNDFDFINYEIRFYSLEFSVNYTLQNKGKRTPSKNISPEIVKFLDDLSSDIQSLNPKYKNDRLSNLNREHKLELKPGIGEQMLELFLSKELKNIVDYNKMQLELPTNNDSISKKLKI